MPESWMAKSGLLDWLTEPDQCVVDVVKGILRVGVRCHTGGLVVGVLAHCLTVVADRDQQTTNSCRSLSGGIR